MAKAVQGFPLPPEATVLVSSENSTIVSYINKEGGRLPFPLERDRDSVPAGLQAANLSTGCPHPRKDECHSRPAVWPRPDSPHRVVTQLKGCEAHVPSLGLSPCRSSCHQVERQTVGLCVSSAGPPGPGSGHSLFPSCLISSSSRS